MLDELFTKFLDYALIASGVQLGLVWVSGGNNNHRQFYFGLFFFLLALVIFFYSSDPIEIGIAENTNNDRILFVIPIIFGSLGFILMAIAILNDRLGIKYNAATCRMEKIHKHKINLRDGRVY